MKLLALDTAANLCSVAVLDVESGTILAASSEDIGKGHAERLMAAIEQVATTAQISITDIGKIAVSIGPGFIHRRPRRRLHGAGFCACAEMSGSWHQHASGTRL